MPPSAGGSRSTAAAAKAAYLQEARVPELMDEMVSALCDARPEDPRGFLARYLSSTSGVSPPLPAAAVANGSSPTGQPTSGLHVSPGLSPPCQPISVEENDVMDPGVMSPTGGGVGATGRGGRGGRGRGERDFRPRRIIVIRHGQSEGNINQSIYETTPDHALHLTSQGWEQAVAAGERLKGVIGDESVHFVVSPYVRTMETFHGIARAWGGADRLPWKEEPRVREQDFGNYQDPSEMQKAKGERARYGIFWYRFTNGESGADVYDRISTWLESLHRYWEDSRGAYQNCVLVAHGLTNRVFLCRFLKWTVDEFNTYENPGNCEACVLERDSGWALYTITQVLCGSGEVLRHPRQAAVKDCASRLRKINTSPPA